MARTTIYICDGCEKPIGNKPHITLLFVGGTSTGVALPPVPEKVIKEGNSTTTRAGRGWKTVQSIKGQFHQFHNGKCAGIFFDKHLKEATNKL